MRRITSAALYAVKNFLKSFKIYSVLYMHICGIIVTYEPDLDVLDKLISAVRSQVGSLVIIDNGSSLTRPLELDYFTIIYNNINVGLATAQNQGIDWAVKNNASHVLIFDQDSEPESDMVGKLCDAENKLLALGHAVAAVGPMCIDKMSLIRNPFYKLNGFRFSKIYTSDFDQFTEVIFLISSGQLIRIEVLLLVGYMKDELFIDYIDMEWGLRASALGYKSYGVINAKMFHSVGDGALVTNNIRFPIHSPTRTYYMTRNAILLYRSRKYPIKWVVADSFVLIRRIFFAIFFCNPRREHMTNAILGLAHALMRRSGCKLVN